jgi:3-deoxy-D-arabino-heptulosonate 7-phosphate (DAHP) synthase class II
MQLDLALSSYRGEDYVVLREIKPGDCAELFGYCNQEMIEAKVKLILQMSLILIWGIIPSILE